MIALWLAAQAASPAYDPALEARVYDRACELVRHRYWNKPRLGPAWDEACDGRRDAAIAAPDRAGFYARLNALLDTLGDSHVFAVDPVRVGLERARDRGRMAGGFGLAMAPDADGRWRVEQVRPGGAAAAAGVRPGWEVRTVDGRAVDVDWQPRPGERALFSFLRPDGAAVALMLDAEREAPLPTRRAQPLGGGLWLAALDGFALGDDRWLRDLLRDERPTALALDLRQNDGGDADVVARVAGAFFTENRPLVERVAAHRGVQLTAGAGPDAFRGPLAVLVGPESASGAEALAALVAESGRGLTVGARTAGALTGAAVYRLPDGGELSVAEFDIRTPGGERLEGRGLAPLLPVAPTPAERREDADPVLARAVTALRGALRHEAADRD